MGEISAQVFSRPSWLTVPAPAGLSSPAGASPLLEELAEAYQLNETQGLRMGSVGGARLKPYAGGTADAHAIARVAGPTGLGYAAQFEAANSEHLSQAISGGSVEAVELGGLGSTGWWIWCWVKFTSLPAVDASVVPLFKGDAIVGTEYGLEFFNNGGVSYLLRLSVTGYAEFHKVIVPDTTGWHLIEGWWDPATELLNVAYDGGAPGTLAATAAHASKACPLHLGGRGHSTDMFNGAVAAVGIRKLAPQPGERGLLWNSAAGAAYPFGAVSGGTRSARLDNTGGSEAVPAGGALPLFLPPSFDWENVYYGNGDDITAEDVEGNPLTVWPERVDKGNRFGRLWVAAPADGVDGGDTADITLSYGDPDQESSANYSTIFAKRTADADTIALFHCDVVEEPAFDPDSIAGLTLDENPAIFGLSDNDPITSAPDSSSVGNDYGQATGANKPTFKEAILNGKAVMRFDGGDYLDGPASSALISAAAHTVFIVAKVTTYTVIGVGHAAGADAGSLWRDVDTYHGITTDSGAAGTDPEVLTSLHDGGHKMINQNSDNDWHVFEVRHTGGNLYVRQDGGAEVSVAAGNVGALTGLTRIGQGFTGDIARQLVYNTAVSDVDRTYIRDGLVTEYAL